MVIFKITVEFKIIKTKEMIPIANSVTMHEHQPPLPLTLYGGSLQPDRCNQYFFILLILRSRVSFDSGELIVWNLSQAPYFCLALSATDLD